MYHAPEYVARSSLRSLCSGGHRLALTISPWSPYWEFVSNIVGSGTVTNGIEYLLIAGAVSEGAAAEFMGFLKIARTIQSPDMILMNPEKSDNPEEAATLYAISTALARKAIEGNMDRVVAYANRLPDEFSVLLVKDALDRDPAVANTRAYIVVGVRAS